MISSCLTFFLSKLGDLTLGLDFFFNSESLGQFFETQSVDSNFFLHISFSLVEISLHVEFHLLG